MLGSRCRFLFLAPCCMPSGVPPRKGQTTVSVQLDEIPAAELQAQTAKELRKARFAQDRDLCWRCGEAGHSKRECCAPESCAYKYKANRAHSNRSTQQINLLDVGASSDPFSAWVGGLSSAVAPSSVVQRLTASFQTSAADEDPEPVSSTSE